MANNITEMVFILDRSGSMNPLTDDTIGGFNSMIAKQKDEKGEAKVTTVMFNNYSETVHDRIDIHDVPELTRKTYCPGGSTALIDAIGGTIDHISKIHKYIRPEDVPEHTIVVITTDGCENSSHKYSASDVRKTIEKKQKEGWEFIFLGANIDSVETAGRLGIREEMAVNYRCDTVGTRINYECINEALRNVRSSGKAGREWRDKIDKDYGSGRK